MNRDGDDVDVVLRRAIGGDEQAIRWIDAQADGWDDPTLLVVAGVLAGRADRVERAQLLASSSRDRQMAAIADAYLRGQPDRVDALARDHLVDFPDSLVVAWIASSARGAP